MVGQDYRHGMMMAAVVEGEEAAAGLADSSFSAFLPF